ncbi:MAG TPA: ABC transporter ATP-binding protein [Candidatus Rokubacteria bacterium]|nr:ABC transporter ATP-binding protein [Candidatus Rokubacteria bacterium]
MALLETTRVRKWFGDTHAVDDVDFVVNQGELLGLIGSNGAGKTTLVNLISGLLRPDAGRIVFDGVDVTRQSVHERIREGIARSFQLVNLFDQMTVQDNVALTIFAREGKTRRMTALAERDRAVLDEAGEVLQRFGLESKARMLAGGLAQGERKLLDVAVAYALRPKLLFLDEPTSGVSTREKAPIMDIIRSVVRAGGITAVIVEHDMDVVFRIADRITVLHEGKVIADGRPDEVRGDRLVNEVYLGRVLEA